MQKANFQLLAQYNQWMNEKIFDAAAQLSEHDLRQDKGAFFGSVLGTLNHLMVGDILWLKRFAAAPEKFRSLESVRELENPESLDTQPHQDLDSLNAARQKLDYQNFRGDGYRDQLALLVQHLFNHQTHHRGQITTLLNQADIDVGPTDLLVCIREI